MYFFQQAEAKRTASQLAAFEQRFKVSKSIPHKFRRTLASIPSRTCDGSKIVPVKFYGIRVCIC